MRLLYVASMMCVVLPTCLQSMLRTVCSAKRSHAVKKQMGKGLYVPCGAACCNKNVFDASALALRQLIAEPNFTYVDARLIINETVPYFPAGIQERPNSCQVNGLLQYVVERAAKYQRGEYTGPDKAAIMEMDDIDRYADIITQLSERGWKCDSACCTRSMLHQAVQHDLFYVAEALLEDGGNNYFVTDEKGRFPVHYLRTPWTADIILKHMSGSVNVQDKDKNSPLHLVTACIVPSLVMHGAKLDLENKHQFVRPYFQTPLRKAVLEGDEYKCKALLVYPEVIKDSFERDILIHVARQQFDLTRNQRYNNIIYALNNILLSR